MTVKTYRSRLDLLLFWPYLVYICAVLLLTFVSGRWYLLPLAGMPIGLIFAKYFTTSYTLSDNGKLEIASQNVLSFFMSGLAFFYRPESLEAALPYGIAFTFFTMLSSVVALSGMSRYYKF